MNTDQKWAVSGFLVIGLIASFIFLVVIFIVAAMTS